MKQTLAVFTQEEMDGPGGRITSQQSVTGPASDLDKMSSKWWDALNLAISTAPDGHTVDARVSCRTRSRDDSEGYAEVKIGKLGTRFALDRDRVIEIQYGLREVEL